MLITEPTPRVNTDSLTAQRELQEIDTASGMSRLLRECLLQSLGQSAPQKLKDYETAAAAARARVTR